MIMFIIHSNCLRNLYIGIASDYNRFHKPGCCRQSRKEFSLYFYRLNDAEAFLQRYFNAKNIEEYNRIYYSIYSVDAPDATMEKTSLYGIDCYYSQEALAKFRDNYELYY